MMRNFYQPLKFIFLIASDYLAYLTALSLAVFVRLWLPDFLVFIDFPNFYPSIYFNPEAHIFPILTFAMFFFYNLYQKRLTFWEESLLIWKSLILSCLSIYLIMFNFSGIFNEASRIVLALAFCSMMILTPLFRWITKNILYHIGFWHYPVLIACAPKDISEVERIVQAFINDSFSGFIPIAFYIPQYSQPSLSINKKTYPICNNINDLKKYNTSTLFIVGEELVGNHDLLSRLYGHFRRIYLIPKNLFGLMNAGVQYLFSEQLFIITLENKINSIKARLIKNIWDYIGGFFILLACSPLLIITAIAVKLTSPGPIFYRHERIGKNGKIFKIWKFRSMVIDADKKLQNLLASDPKLKKEWDTYFKLSRDPRITPIGNFLRKYSIDEFPQLFNVLAGEMSLIGPRPFVKGEMEELNPDLVPLYTQLKPGLTGLWQVSGRNDTDRLHRMKIDVWYIQNWSPALDLLILLNTPKAVLTARGAR